jgi:hypothetical protein
MQCLLPWISDQHPMNIHVNISHQQSGFVNEDTVVTNQPRNKNNSHYQILCDYFLLYIFYSDQLCTHHNTNSKTIMDNMCNLKPNKMDMRAVEK